MTQSRQEGMQDGQSWQLLEFNFESVQNGTKDGLRVSISDGIVMQIVDGCFWAQQGLIFQGGRIVKFRNLAIMSEGPLNAPQFAGKGMDIFQTHSTRRGIANMSNHILQSMNKT
jgi:hypothetical protein